MLVSSFLKQRNNTCPQRARVQVGHEYREGPWHGDRESRGSDVGTTVEEMSNSLRAGRLGLEPGLSDAEDCGPGSMRGGLGKTEGFRVYESLARVGHCPGPHGTARGRDTVYGDLPAFQQLLSLPRPVQKGHLVQSHPISVRQWYLSPALKSRGNRGSQGDLSQGKQLSEGPSIVAV